MCWWLWWMKSAMWCLDVPAMASTVENEQNRMTPPKVSFSFPHLFSITQLQHGCWHHGKGDADGVILCLPLKCLLASWNTQVNHWGMKFGDVQWVWCESQRWLGVQNRTVVSSTSYCDVGPRTRYCTKETVYLLVHKFARQQVKGGDREHSGFLIDEELGYEECTTQRRAKTDSSQSSPHPHHSIQRWNMCWHDFVAERSYPCFYVF